MQTRTPSLTSAGSPSSLDMAAGGGQDGTTSSTAPVVEAAGTGLIEGSGVSGGDI